MVPSDTQVLQDGPPDGTDEGRAMAQIIHSIAPDAQIVFDSGAGGQASIAAAIQALQNAGCNIIVDDLIPDQEPMYELGSPVETAIDAAVSAGVTYFTAAGNAGGAYYENTFNGMTATLFDNRTVIANNFGSAGNFSPYLSVTIPYRVDSAGVQLPVHISLQWDQPFESIGTGLLNQDNESFLNFYLYDLQTKQIVASGSALGFDPVATFSGSLNDANTNYDLVVYEPGIESTANIASPGQFKVIFENDAATINDPNAGVGSGSIFGHALDPNAITVGAVDYHNTLPFGGTLQSEPFSSTGPGELLIDPNGKKPLATPIILGKPDISAPDGGATTVFDPFYGTSAAAPAAAAVGALMLQARNTLNPNDIKNLLEDSPLPFGDPTQSGAGLIDAPTAMEFASTLRFREGLLEGGSHTILGTHLDDTFVYDIGDFTLNGEGGTNTADYSLDPYGITVDAHDTHTVAKGTYISLPLGIPTSAGTDTFTNIQAFTGGTGPDMFIGGLGGYFFDGGPGSDTLSYSWDPFRLTINLQDHSADDNGPFRGGPSDRFANIETFFGSAGGTTFKSSLEDNLTFNGAANVSNTLDYSWDIYPIVVNLSGTPPDVIKDLADSSIETDQFSNIQNFIGSLSDNTFISGIGDYSFDASNNALLGSANTLDYSWEQWVTIDLQTEQVTKLKFLSAGNRFIPEVDGVDTFSNIQNFFRRYGQHNLYQQLRQPGCLDP
jgi:hypothetical protein